MNLKGDAFDHPDEFIVRDPRPEFALEAFDLAYRVEIGRFAAEVTVRR